MKFMFDTNIFDKLLAKDIDLSIFSDMHEFFVTHIQKDEIDAISKPEKQEWKTKLLNLFKSLNEGNIPTESFILGTSRLGAAKLSSVPTESMVWGVSRWDEAKWTNPKTSLIEELRKGNLKHTEDALIGETAIKKEFILVTEDNNLFNKFVALGGKAIRFEQFLKGDFE